MDIVLEKKHLWLFLLIPLFIWYGFFSIQKINLSTADLGRHLKNGELLLKKDFAVLKTNFYSYTEPNFSTINHHWVNGVIFFLLWKIGGFKLIHLFFVALSFFIFYISFRLARERSNMAVAILLCLALIPFIAQRKEVRPEIFSYCLCALFFFILCRYRQKSISPYLLFLLPLLEIFWINAHIYFLLGPLFIIAFLLEVIFSETKNKKNQFKYLTIVLALTMVAMFFNPSGIKGVLYPIRIFNNYGYRLVENQSPWFLEKLGFIKNPNFLFYKIIASVLLLSFILVFIKKRRKFSISEFCLATGFIIMAGMAIRNFTILGFFALPILARNINSLSYDKKIQIWDALAISPIILFLGFFVYYQHLPAQSYGWGLGLADGINQGAEFFKKENIQGPIFNNYDIGGYLIYHLYPQYQVFVDNRPEAYPEFFFQDIYIPIQDKEEMWLEKQEDYQFNAIVFSHHDATPWGQKFLVNRVKDPLWIPVFIDQYMIIFLKRNELNKPIIVEYEIPQNYFSVSNIR